VKFIDEHKDHRVGDGLRWGVESICTVLSEHGAAIAPSTYYDARARTPSAQDRRDEQLKEQIARVHRDNYSVYGARKVWLELNRKAIPVARCTVERLMTELCLRGARRGRKVRTTKPDPAVTRPPDRVNRNFAPRAPNQLWVADFSYLNLGRDGLRGLRYRRLRSAHPRLAHGHLDDHCAGARRAGTSRMDPTP
jgi:putative transposase